MSKNQNILASFVQKRAAQGTPFATVHVAPSVQDDDSFDAIIMDKNGDWIATGKGETQEKALAAAFLKASKEIFTY